MAILFLFVNYIFLNPVLKIDIAARKRAKQVAAVLTSEEQIEKKDKIGIKF